MGGIHNSINNFLIISDMTVKIIDTILGIFLGVTCIYAQTGEVRVASVGQKFQILPSPLPTAEVIDTAKYTVYYLHTYPVDNFSDDYSSVADTLVTQIGTHICKTFSQNLHLWDRNLTYQEGNKIKFRHDYIAYEVFWNYPEGKITTQQRIPYSRLLSASTQIVEFREELPETTWHITDARNSIGDYSCFFAEGRFGGRVWKVWFTPEIPLPYGPWKLGGLPGLILKAEDESGTYKFEIQRISRVSNPIERYHWHPVSMSKSQWLKKERQMYKHPKDYFFPNETIGVLDLKTHQPLTEEWTVRYDPIEFE